MEREDLERLVERSLTIRQIATELGCSTVTVQRWLSRHDLKTQTARQRAASEQTGSCRRHGAVDLRLDARGSPRCARCRSEAVSRRRRRVKETLVAEAGGACVLCGYARCIRALHFHHVDPESKAFGLAHQGFTRSLATMRQEIAKCVLLCSNCHMEVEAGVTALPSGGGSGRG